MREWQIEPSGIKELSRPAFLSLGTVVILGQIILCSEEAVPVLCCRIFSNILDLYPLDLPRRDNQKSPQSWPDVLWGTESALGF